MDRDGAVLFLQSGRCNDGATPYFGGLIADSAGNLYGTTAYGGLHTNGVEYGPGVVFKLAPPVPPATQWTETVLHSFTGGSDGFFPYAGLTADSAGNLYGTTKGGGVCSQGKVFKLSPPVPPATQWTETVLYSFCNDSPSAGLIADNAGNLYGTSGVIFRLSPPVPPATQWTETVLHYFSGSDGGAPRDVLTFDSNGNLLGTTYEGGAYGFGVVFKLSP